MIAAKEFERGVIDDMGFNTLERRAENLLAAGRVGDAMAIHLFMTDGDPSLDAGSLAFRIGGCRERLADLHSTNWW